MSLVISWQLRCVNHLIPLIELIFGAACTLDPLRDGSFTVTGIAAIAACAITLKSGQGSLARGFIIIFIKALVFGVLLIVFCLAM